jgi:hypothetical protein
VIVLIFSNSVFITFALLLEYSWCIMECFELDIEMKSFSHLNRKIQCLLQNDRLVSISNKLENMARSHAKPFLGKYL